MSFYRLSILLSSLSILYATTETDIIFYHGQFLSVPIGSKQCNVYDYGAKGDGIHDDTQAVQNTINSCSTGGMVIFPKNGTYMVYPLTTPSSTSSLGFQIDGTLRFFNDTNKWPTKTGPCISIDGSNIVITGLGVVDGNGAVWWPNPHGYRPNLLNTNGVHNILITGTNVPTKTKDDDANTFGEQNSAGTNTLTFLNSPNHNLELFAAPMEVYNVYILAPGNSPNTDGIDVHGSPAYIHNMTISVGDDHIAMHANDTLVTNCTFGTGHGASIGSLGANTALKNITVNHCSFNGAQQAIRIKCDQTGASGFLHDVTYSDITVADTETTIIITEDYTENTRSNSNLPIRNPLRDITVSNVVFRNIVASNSATTGEFICHTDSPCTNITVENVIHINNPSKQHGWTCQEVYGTVQNVTPPLTCFSK